MTRKLQILRVDNDLVQKANLVIGNNIIGSGVATECKDSQVLKHAVTINVSDNDEMTITPVAPCYMKSAGFTGWQLLKLGITVPIKPNDICSLSDKCWFKVVSVPDTMEDGDQASKREINQEDVNNEADSKRACLLSSMEAPTSPHQSLNGILYVKNTNEHKDYPKKGNVEHGDVVTSLAAQIDSSSSPEGSNMPVISSKMSTDSQDVIEPSVKHENNRKRKANNINLNKTATNGESGKKIKWDCDAHISDQTEAILDESPVATANNQAKASNPDRVPREKCTYGPQCYRKNPNHKNNYSHPDDSDYDEIDDREECPYGVKCYRKNPRHKKQFKHTTVPRRRRRAGTALNPIVIDNMSEIDESSAEESIDESDYEPSVYTDSSDDWDDKSEPEDGITG